MVGGASGVQRRLVALRASPAARTAGAAFLVFGVGVLLAVLPLTLAGALVIGGLVALAVLLRPAVGLYLLPFAVPFGSLKEVTLAGARLGGTEILLALVTAAWLARVLATRDTRRRPVPLLIPFLVFLGVASLSLLAATSLTPAVIELVKWGEVLLAYLLASQLIRDGRQAAVLLGALLLAGTAEAVAGVVSSLLRLGPPAFAILGGRLYRAYGQFGQPNPFGGYMNLVWPLAASMVVALMLSVRAKTGELNGTQRNSTELRRTGGNSGIAAVALVFVLGSLFSALILSWSRGAWLGAAAGGVVLAGGWLVAAVVAPGLGRAGRAVRVRAGLLVGLALTLVMVAILAGLPELVPSSVTGRLESITAYLGGLDPTRVEITDENFATVERLAHWKAAADMWRDHLWLGVGIGNYPAVYARYAVPRWDDPLGHAHNYYLNLGAETGLLGLLAYLILLGAMFWHVTRAALRTTDALSRGVALGVLGVLVALSVHNLFDNIYVHSMGVHLGLCLGLVTTLETMPVQRA